MKQRMLVTGGAGYIGAHCCSALSNAGYLPVCFDDLSTGHSDFVKWGPLVTGDVRDTRKVSQALVEHRIQAVIHFAASSLVGESVADPEKYYSNNLVGSLQCCRRCGMPVATTSSFQVPVLYMAMPVAAGSPSGCRAFPQILTADP